MLCNYSALNEATLKEIHAMEKSLGVKLLAFSCFEPEIAQLSEEQLDKLRKLEEKVGTRLVAIQ